MGSLFNSSSKTHQVQKTDVPQNYQTYLNSLLTSASSINNPFQAYTDPRIADLTANETQGINLAASGAGQYQPLIDLANNTTAANLGNTVPTQGDLDQYMNPFIDSVLNRTIGRLNDQAQVNNVQIGSNAAKSGAFGGTRQGVVEGANWAELLKSTGDQSANAYKNAYDSAMSNFFNSKQLSRGLTSDLLNGAQAGQRYNLGDINSLMDTGLTQRTQQQAGLDFNYGEFLRQDQDTANNAMQMAQIAQMYPRDIFTRTQDSKTTNTPSVMSDIAGIAAIGAGIMSGGSTLALGAGQSALGAMIGAGAGNSGRKRGGLIKGYAFGGQIPQGNPLAMLQPQGNMFGGRFNQPNGMGIPNPLSSFGGPNIPMGGGRGFNPLMNMPKAFAGGGGVTSNDNRRYNPNEPGLIDTPMWGDILDGLSALGTGAGRVLSGAASGIDEGISWLNGRDQPFGETESEQDTIKRLDAENIRRQITNDRHRKFFEQFGHEKVNNPLQTYAKGGKVKANLQDLLHPVRVNKKQKNDLPRMRSFKEGGEVDGEMKFTPRQWEPPSFLERQNYIQKMFGVESGGRSDSVNSKSGAFGRYQFIPSTYNSIARRLGLPETSKADVLAGKLPPVADQDRVFNEGFFPEQINTLRSHGLEPNQVNLYLTHHFDPNTAVRIATADRNSPIADALPASNRDTIIRQNKGEPLSGTVGDYLSFLSGTNTKRHERGFAARRNPDEILSDYDRFGLPVSAEAKPMLDQKQMDALVDRQIHPEKYFREAIREDQPNRYVRFANPLDGTKGPLYIRQQDDSTIYSRQPRQPNPEEAFNELPMSGTSGRVDFPGYTNEAAHQETPPSSPINPIDLLRTGHQEEALPSNPQDFLDNLIINDIRRKKKFADGGFVQSEDSVLAQRIPLGSREFPELAQDMPEYKAALSRARWDQRNDPEAELYRALRNLREAGGGKALEDDVKRAQENFDRASSLRYGSKFAKGRTVHSQLDDNGEPVVTLPVKDRVTFVPDAGADVPMYPDAYNGPSIWDWMGDNMRSGKALQGMFGPDRPQAAPAEAPRNPFSAGPLGILGSPGEQENFPQAPNTAGLTDDLQGAVDDSSVPGSLVDPLQAASDRRQAGIDEKMNQLLERALGRYNTEDKPENPLFGLFPHANKPLVELGLGILANSGYPNSFGEAVGKAGLGVMKGQEEDALRATDRDNAKLKELINLQYMRGMIQNMDPATKMRYLKAKGEQDFALKLLEDQQKLRDMYAKGAMDYDYKAKLERLKAELANPLNQVQPETPDSQATDIE